MATGDDVVGFPRGFLYAETNSPVASLWQVDDRATCDLMVSFYSSLKGIPKDESLRQAQIKVKEQYPHPNSVRLNFFIAGNNLNLSTS